MPDETASPVTPQTAAAQFIPAVPAAVVPVAQPGVPVAPVATGYVPPPVLPTTPIMPKQTYSSAMSYVGITRRTTALVRRVGAANGAVMALAVTAAVIWLLVMYAVVTVWYLVVGFLFGWLLFPFRLIRRSHRKQEALQKQQLATMQAMLIQQQQQQYRG